MIFRVTSYKLKSGNEFMFFQGDVSYHPFGVVIDENRNFLGGFLGRELQKMVRKFTTFAVETEEKNFSFGSIDISDFLDKVGVVSHYLKTGKSLMVSDTLNCGGTSSDAKTCSSRRDYYSAFGLETIYESFKKFPLLCLVANHLSVSSNKFFKGTFYPKWTDDKFGMDSSAGCDIEEVRFYQKTSYYSPAYYIRAFVNSQCH